MQNLRGIRIDKARFRANFDALSKIGATPDGGCHRPALGEDDRGARQWFQERIVSAGLEYHLDEAANQSALLRCGRGKAPHLVLGSHLDTVPRGGRFDGALGVLAALEVLQSVQEAGLSLALHLEAINFTDEEGTHIGLLGSRALTGRMGSHSLAHPHQGPEAFAAGYAQLGLDTKHIAAAHRNPDTLGGYLELHIEQGARLIAAGNDIGIVTSITGIQRLKVTFTGRADHAGTTAIADRRDAGRAACRFAESLWEMMPAEFSDAVANVGDMHFRPGIFNVVPVTVALDLEFRAATADEMDSLRRRVDELAADVAAAVDVSAEVIDIERVDPAMMSDGVIDTFKTAARALGLSRSRLHSGAGHDAQSFAGICPVGMIFIPSVDGLSHSTREYSHWKDCLNGANLLLQAALALAV